MLDVLSLAEQDTNLRRAAINEQAGSCPKCHGTDRFRVRWNGESWSWMCRHCWDASQFIPEKGRKRGWGDDIDYLRHIRGMSFQEAKRLAREGKESETPVRAAPPQGADYRDTRWQEATALRVKECEEALWEAEGSDALAFASKRGFTDATIRGAHMGYSNAGNVPRLVIPTFNRGRYVAVSTRDLRPDVAKDKRWKEATGSRKIEFYGLDMLARKGYPVALCEDAFSALSIIQECRELVNAVATGGVEACRNIEMVAELAVAPLVLVAFDADASGDDKATWWLDRLSNAKRLRPLLKDANDMLQAGWDLRQWIEDALPVACPAEQLPCSVCGMDANTAPEEVIFHYDDDGVFFCQKCGTSPTSPDIPVASTTDTKERFQRKVEAIIKELPDRWQDPRVSDLIPEQEVGPFKQTITDSYRQANGRPEIDCRICKAHSWIPYTPEGWICLECLSPAYGPVTLRSKAS